MGCVLVDGRDMPSSFPVVIGCEVVRAHADRVVALLVLGDASGDAAIE